MDDLFNELLQLLEKTTVIVEFDITKIGYMNYGQSEADQGIEPNEEDKYYYYIVIVDGYSSILKYSKRIDSLIQTFSSEIEIQIDNKFYYKDVKKRLNQLKSVIAPIYSKLDINLFSDQIKLNQRIIGPNRSRYFEPNIYINYINGNELDSDFGEFNKIAKFVVKKYYCANRVMGLVENSLERLKENGGNGRLGTIRFREENLINGPRFKKFRTKLNDSDLIDKLDARLFDKCFFGNEVNEKLNWKSDNLSFVYFVRQLNPYLINSKRINWNAVSNTFSLNSQTIVPKKIRTTTALCSKEKRGIIDEIIKQLDLPKTV